MKHSIISATAKNKLIVFIFLCALFVLMFSSLFIGKYPLQLSELLRGNTMQWRVFLTLRLGRVLVGALGGFALGAAGFVYQTVFRNPLASPDVIGVSSGASAGAAAGILFFSFTAAAVLASFVGALISVFLAIALSAIDRNGKNSTIVLAGIAVHSIAQTVLMCLKCMADPERELAAIEYWIMGSLSGISIYSAWGNLILCLLSTLILFLLHRQIILLSAEDGEAKMLGADTVRLRLAVLLTASLTVAGVVSITGLISFIGLLAPHTARLLHGHNRISTMFLSGLVGAVILLAADMLARSLAPSELPISIFTSILGAPFLIFLVVRGRQNT